MMAAISEKTGWSTSLLITMVGFAVAIAVAFAKAQGDVAHLEVTVKEIRAEQKAASDLRTQHELRIQRTEDNYASILKALGRLEANFDRLTIRRGPAK